MPIPLHNDTAPIPLHADVDASHSPKYPELNPVESVWQLMRSNWLFNCVFKSEEDILDHSLDDYVYRHARRALRFRSMRIWCEQRKSVVIIAECLSTRSLAPNCTA